MSKFNKGDRVQYVGVGSDVLTNGRVYTVLSTDGEGIYFKGDTGTTRYRMDERFILHTASVDRFKAGDKVRVRTGSGSGTFSAGDVLTVEAVTGRDEYGTVKVSGSTRYWAADRFDKIETPAPEFSKGDRIRVTADATQTLKRGKVGTVERFVPYATTTLGRETEGYYNVRLDGETYDFGVWDFNVEAHAPKFKKGDRVERTGPSHFTDGYSGHDYKDLECKHGDAGTVTGDSGVWAGSYGVQWDGGRSSVIGGQCLKAAAAKPFPFKTGDKAKVIEHLRYSVKATPGMTATQRKFYTGHVGETVTIEAVDTFTNSVKVRYVHGGHDSRVDVDCLAVHVEPKAAAKFLPGDRVELRFPYSPNVISGTGVVIRSEYPATFGTTRIDVKWDGEAQGWRTDINAAYAVKAAPKPQPAPVAFKRGDKVIAGIVPALEDRYNGKPGTYVRAHSFNDKRHLVRFADGKQYWAGDLTAYDAAKVRFRDLEKREQDAKILAGKIAKLQSLAKELGYDVFPVKAAA